MKRRIFAAFAAFFLCGIFGGWLRWGLPAAESALSRRVPALAARAAGIELRMRDVRVHPLLLHVDFLDVSAKLNPDDPPFFTCERWRLELTPARLRRTRPWFAFVLGRSVLEKPYLDAARLKDYRPPAPSAERTVFRWPLIHVIWSKGTLLLPKLETMRGKEGPVLDMSLSDWSGDLSASPSGLVVKSQAAGPLGPVAARLRVQDWKNMNALLSMDMELQKVSDAFYQTPGLWEGALRVDLRARSPWPPAADALQWRAKGEWKRAQWRADAEAAPVPLGGSLDLTPRRLLLHEVSVGEALRFSGRVTKPLSETPWVAVNLNGQAIDLARTQAMWPGAFLRKVPVAGEADVAGTIEGRLSSPVFRAHVSVQNPQVALVVFPRWDADVSARPDALDASVSLLGGRVNVAGRREGLWTWDVKTQGLDIADWARVNNWGDIAGLLNFEARWHRDTLTGDVSVENFRWSTHRESDRLAAAFRWQENQLSVSGERNLFRVDARQEGEDWVLSNVDFALPSGLVLKAQGRVIGAERRYDLALDVKNVPARDIPVLMARYPEMEGQWDFMGRLSGTAKSPMFKGEAGFRDLSLRPGGRRLSGLAVVEWTRQGLLLPSFDVAGYLEGDGRLSADGWELNMQVNDAPADLAADLLRASGTVEGVLKGDCRLTAETPGWPTGAAQLTVTDGRWNDFRFKSAKGVVQLERGVLSLRSLDVDQSSGAWHAEGRFPLEATREDWSATAQFKHFSLPTAVLDGEVSLLGETSWLAGSRRAKLSSPIFFVNGIALHNLRAELSADKRRWAVESAAVGDWLSGHARLGLDDQKLSGAWTVKRMDLADWGPVLGLDARFHRGFLSGGARITGTRKEPKTAFEVAWSSGAWNGVPMNLSLRGEWAPGRLMVESMRAWLPEGGEALGKGTLAYGGSQIPTDLDLKLDGVPMARIASLLGQDWPVQGAVNGRLRWEGSLQEPVIHGSLEGKELSWGEHLLSEWLASIQYIDKELQVREAYAKTAEGLWRVKEGSRAIFTGEGEGQLELKSDLRNIHMGQLSFFGGLDLIGRWETRPARRLETVLRARSLWVNQYRLDQDLAYLVWSKDKITFDPKSGGAQSLSGEIDLSRLPQVFLKDLRLSEKGRRKFWMNGEVGPGRWDFQMEGTELEAQALLSLADLDVPMEGRLEAHLTGKGSAQDPQVEGTLLGREGSMGRLPYDKVEGKVFWRDQMVQLKDVRAVRKNGYVIEGEGRFPTQWEENESAEQNLFFSFRLKDGNLAVLKDIWPDCRSARGSMLGELQLLPGRSGPRMAGFLAIDNGRITAQKYFKEMTDVKGRLLLQDDQLTIEQLSGRIGRGRLLVQGRVALQGLKVAAYDLSAETVGREGIMINVPQLSVPPGPLLQRFSLLRQSFEGASQGEPQVFLKLTGPGSAPKVQGTIVMNNTQFTYPPSKESKNARAVPPDWWRDFLRDAYWDLRFKTGENTWYRNEYVNVQIKGQIDIWGRQGGLGGSGRVDVQRGDINYLGQNFTVKRGVFEIVTDTRTAVTDKTRIPYISGEAERLATTVDSRGFTAPDTIIMVVDRAPIGEIQPRFISRNNPELSSARVAQMALGLSGDQVTPEKRDQILRAGMVQLVGSSAGPLVRDIGRRFGIYILDPIYAPKDTTPNPDLPGLTVDKRRRTLAEYAEDAGFRAGLPLSSRVFGFYKGTVDTTETRHYFHDELELIYRVTGNLHLRASTELDSEKLLGQPPNRQAVLENQWRFGPPRLLRPPAEAQVSTTTAPAPFP